MIWLILLLLTSFSIICSNFDNAQRMTFSTSILFLDFDMITSIIENPLLHKYVNGTKSFIKNELNFGNDSIISAIMAIHFLIYLEHFF